MDEVDAVPRPRRQRPKDPFQNELKTKLYQRRSLGLSAEVTDSDEDEMASPRMNSDYLSNRAARPGSAKRRSDHSSDLSRGLGTTTMRARDLTSMLGRDTAHSDDEDEEVMAATLGKSSYGRSLQSGGLKSISPKQESSFMRKTPTRESPKDQSMRLESIYGKKTPTKDISPRSGSLSKEDIIFGRKTPVDGKKPVPDGSQRKLPGVDSDKPWQPPIFRSASPGSSEHSRGSRGVTPVDAVLDTISETPREKVTPRMQRGQRMDSSPKQISFDERPKPQTRGKVGERKTPPLIDPRRKSPSSPSETQGVMKRTTPTLDLFGRSRVTAAQEVDEYIGDKDRKLHGGGRTPEGRQPLGRGDRVSPSISGDHKSKERSFSTKDRSSPTSTEFTRYDRKTPGERKTPPSLRKSPLERKSSEKEKESDRRGSSLLDFLTEGATSKPKPQQRKSRSHEADDQDLDDILVSNKKAEMRNKSIDSHKSFQGRKSPGIGVQGRKSPEQFRKSPVPFAESGESQPMTDLKQQRPEDTSSLCEEIPPDPNRKVARETERAMKSGKGTTERTQANIAIDTIANAQTMKYIEPAKKVRPVTAQAKVQHRPKPRYGALPGQGTTTLQERQFNSTGDIRDAIYEEWYKERLMSARKKMKEEEKNKKELEQKKLKEKEDKHLEAEASYRAWMKNKKETLHDEQIRKMREQKLKEQKELEENEGKRETASKTFDIWKKRKDSMIRRELRKKEDEEQRVKEEKEYEKRMKDKERETAYLGWERKKEKQRKANIFQKKEEKKNAMLMTEEERKQLREKEEEAMNQYYNWMHKKDVQAKREKKLARQRSLMDEENYKPAWSPASRTIPFGS